MIGLAPALSIAETIVLAALTDAAEHARPCPTNEDLAERLNFVLSAPPGIMARLERRELIRVERFQRERRVTIMATGKQTAAVRTPAPHWRDRPAVPERGERNVPAPAVATVRERRPDVARDILAEAQRRGRSPQDFLADLVWIGWAHLADEAIQPGASAGVV